MQLRITGISDDLLLSNNLFENLRTIASESVQLFDSRGFKLRKWIANCHSRKILSDIPQCDLATDLAKIDIGANDTLPNSKTLGLTWDPQADVLCVNFKEYFTATTKREISSQLASQFDSLGTTGPHRLGGKIILQRVTTLGMD